MHGTELRTDYEKASSLNSFSLLCAMRKSILTALISLSLIGCGQSSDTNNLLSPEENNTAEQVAQIEGDAYLQSDPGILRGLKVYACKAELRSEFEKVYVEKEPELTEFSAEYGIYDLEYGTMMLALEEVAKTRCNKPVETDIDGHYSISGLEAGKYILFAVLWSSDRNLEPYWLLSVDVEEGKTSKRDINGNEWGIDGQML